MPRPVMHHALNVAASELQMSRTALDANVMGALLYLQMGYQYTARPEASRTPIRKS